MLGESLFQLGDNQGAATAMLNATTLNNDISQLATVYHVLGKTSYAENDYENALHYLHAAVALDSTLNQAYADLGWTYVQLDDCNQARHFFEQALSLSTILSANIRDGLSKCQ